MSSGFQNVSCISCAIRRCHESHEGYLSLQHAPDAMRLRGRRQHPWFTMHLPRYLAVMQADTVATASSNDSDLVAEVGRLGFDRDLIIDSLQNRVQVHI